MAKKARGKKLVIVESPTKAKTIRRFLDNDYIVESCMGHVRDLPQSARDIPEKFKKLPWANLGVNVEKHFEPLYLVPKNKTKVVSSLKEKLKEAVEVILATDEDREGESISWHLVNVLKPDVPVRRMVFNEITREAILEALSEVREIDMNLVRAQEARRILDRLVGYTISPLLWKKVAYGLSAGRVQSVAVRLVCEREHDRIRFKKAEYWDLTATLNKSGQDFPAKLVAYKSAKVAAGKDFDPETGQLFPDRKDVKAFTEADIKKVAAALEKQALTVSSVEEKPLSRKPAPPFITSTLQQESNRKLGLTARETMQVAQKLYERGLITYMRTDSMFLSDQAIKAARDEIASRFGKNFLPPDARDYGGKKVKGAQEAHEAIRPSGRDFVHPDDAGLSGVEYRLYDLIWKRTVASQMKNSEHKQVLVKLEAKDALFSASGMTVEFPGFLQVYVESDDDQDESSMPGEHRLPQLKKGEALTPKKLSLDGHETKPPSRFNEASLVQALEKQGIGRPSTYAAIIGTIQDRGYVRKQGNALVPTITALVVTKLLQGHFPEYVDYDFTSSMEKSLDDIASGDLDSEKYLSSVYLGEKGLKRTVEKREKSIDGDEARGIILEGLKNYVFRVGRYGAYVCRQDKAGEVCASLPETHSPSELTAEMADKLIDQKINGADSIGKDPKTGEAVYVLTGRYGPYVQRGENEGEGDDYKPKRMALPAGLSPENVTLDQALFLLSLPKTLGVHSISKKDIKLGIGRFGPYVVCDGDYRSVPKGEDFFSVPFERAVELLSQPKKGRGRAQALKEFGAHPTAKEPIQLFNGKYGFYLKCGKINASLPNGEKPEDLTLRRAVEILAVKMGEDSPKVKAPPRRIKKTATRASVRR
jgi:DNA topoisomerase I